MYGEAIQKKDGVGQTVRVEGVVVDAEKAKNLGFTLEPNLDGTIQPVALGYDESGRVTGMIPMVLTNIELNDSIKDLKHYNKMLENVAATGRKEFGL